MTVVLSADKQWSAMPCTIVELAQDAELSDDGLRRLFELSFALSPHLCFDPFQQHIKHDEVVSGFVELDRSGWLQSIQVEPEKPVRWLDLPELPSHTTKHPEEWIRLGIKMTMHDGLGGAIHAFRSQLPGVWGFDDPTETFYHGTTSYSAWRILQSGAFIPGPNGYTKCKKHFKGCFGSKLFEIAEMRGDQTRVIEDDGIYSFRSCPVVLELEATCAHLRRYKRGHKHTHLVVLPGEPGSFLPGIVLKAVHWNVRFVRQYLALHNPQTRIKIQSQGGVFVSCCGEGRQRNDFQSCGAWGFAPLSQDPHFVRQGKYMMCHKCAERWRAN